MAKKRRGRPAVQNVQRYACGKVRREYAQKQGETEMQAMATVLAYRARAVSPEHARRNEAGYELGRMFLKGIITKRQHEAGCNYAKLVSDYQRSMGFPSPYPKGIDLGAARGLSLASEPSEARVRRTVNEYMLSITAIADAGKSAGIALREVCVYDRGTLDVENLRIGLDALAGFFGIPLDE